jgi:hypothetical protein
MEFITIPVNNTNDISDGYHTFGELYEHRIRLYIELCKSLSGKRLIWYSRVHSDGTLIPGWFILGIGMERGHQITYHIPEKYHKEISDIYGIVEYKIVPTFDGHTSQDVLDRLKEVNL